MSEPIKAPGEKPGHTCITCRHFQPIQSQLVGHVMGQCFGVPPTPIAVLIKGQPGLSHARPTVSAGERACSLWTLCEDAANASS